MYVVLHVDGRQEPNNDDHPSHIKTITNIRNFKKQLKQPWKKCKNPWKELKQPMKKPKQLMKKLKHPRKKT